jgi:hypothetical protein
MTKGKAAQRSPGRGQKALGGCTDGEGRYLVASPTSASTGCSSSNTRETGGYGDRLPFQGQFGRCREAAEVNRKLAGKGRRLDHSRFQVDVLRLGA